MSPTILIIKTTNSKQIVDITEHLNKFISHQNVASGICIVFTTHTTCCLTLGEIGEGTDADFLEVAQKIIPRIQFRHAHDPSHTPSHMISSLIGPSLSLPFENSKLILGTWQSVLLVELDGPRERKIVITIIGH